MTSLKAQGRYAAMQQKGRREIKLRAMPNPASGSAYQRWNPGLMITLGTFVAAQILVDFHYHNANGWATLPNRIIRCQHSLYAVTVSMIINVLIILSIIKELV